MKMRRTLNALRAGISLHVLIHALPQMAQANQPGFLWAKGIGGSGGEGGVAMAFDASADLYVTGYFNSGNLSFWQPDGYQFCRRLRRYVPCEI